MSAPKLRLYNTLTRSKEDFSPIDPANVRMYVCGPTVYDYAHIGNARPVIVFDVLYRLLRHLYGKDHVKYVRNITDVDDKINARAAERGISIRDLTEETNKIFQEDVKALGCLEPDVQPRATEHIVEMIAIIERLIAQGNAYAADGHVLFSVPSMKDYGKLSRRPLDEMIAGARVDVAPYKKGDMDFVLWKPSKDSEPGWDSPWGRGRPGWHIECSAMSWKHLGETFDIHGGGIDLVFPHHENEIAQSRCAFNHDVMANVWMHNGFLQVEGEKMSKSLGNFVTIHELLHTEKFGGRKWSGEVLRLAMLKTHYRQPIDWTVKALEEAEKEILRWKHIIQRHNYVSKQPAYEFLSALSDDLNTHAALTSLRADVAKANGISSLTGVTPGGPYPDPISDSDMEEAGGRLLAGLALLGIDPRTVPELKKEFEGEISSDVEGLITARLEARKNKNWAESDRIRDELLGMGIQLKDGKDPATGEPITTWEVKR
jgi:cysteinyl-tRNA synthetase